jgi:prepilin-type N-terminal cleavage/methylation domain-containing protein
MNTLKQSSKGFSLIEALIALAISSFVMMGVYTMFSSALRTDRGLNTANDDLIVREALQRLVSRDLRMMRGETVPDLPPDPQNERLFAIVSQNSFTFSKGILVNVVYEVDNSTLYRTESRADMNYTMRMPLLHNVTAHQVESFDGSEYRDDFNPKHFIYKIGLTMDNRTIEFVTGRAVELGK